MRTHKVSLTFLIVLLILTILMASCSGPFASISEPDSVETVVPDSEKPGDWLLSPGGDRIVYASHTEKTLTTFVVFPTTQQKHQVDDCSWFIWLDNTLLLCPTAIVVTDDFLRIPLQQVKSTDVDLGRLLSEAGTIYRFEGAPQSLIVLSDDYRRHPDKNYSVIGIENVDIILQTYPSITVPGRTSVGGPEKKVFSPDEAYYYNLNVGSTASLTIYAAHNDKNLAEVVTKGALIIIMGGWAADSSGVYFQVHGTGIGFEGNFASKAIWKLKVPLANNRPQ